MAFPFPLSGWLVRHTPKPQQRPGYYSNKGRQTGWQKKVNRPAFTCVVYPHATTIATTTTTTGQGKPCALPGRPLECRAEVWANVCRLRNVAWATGGQGRGEAPYLLTLSFNRCHGAKVVEVEVKKKENTYTHIHTLRLVRLETGLCVTMEILQCLGQRIRLTVHEWL